MENQKELSTTLTVKELAEMLHISSAHAYNQLKKNLIPHLKLGSRYIISRHAVLRWLESAPKAHTA